jgi:hypothetical protein
MSWLSEDDNKILEKIRGIWVPFHFLPGNFKFKDNTLTSEYAYTGEKHVETTLRGYDYKEGKDKGDRDKKDFCMMCLHDGPLVSKMLNDTENFIGGDSEDLEKLILIGIRMHVLADTWAHEYFAGTPNYWVNDVSKVEKENGKHYGLIGPTCYSMVYLGHAGAGHLPDYGYLSYKYTAKWSKEPIEIDNQSRFFEAFCQMTNAMSVFKQNRQISDDECSDVHSVFATVSDDQTEAWKYFLEQKNYHIVSYEDATSAIQKINTDVYSVFSEMADKHRDFVINELDAVGIKIKYN